LKANNWFKSFASLSGTGRAGPLTKRYTHTQKSMSQLIKDAIADTMATIVPENINRPWYLEYLFKYKFGNRLPRGKIFDRIRRIESPQKWLSDRQELYADIKNTTSQDRISPFLVDQYALLTLAKIYGLCDFKTKSIFEVIKKLEGGICHGKESLIKHNLSFSNKGILREYRHHHVPLLPNSYLAMLASKDSNLKIINLEAISESITFSNGKFDLNINHLEKNISSRGAKKGGRLTGHWLITKSKNGRDIYLGVFPHSNGKADDVWIKRQLQESERVFDISIKRA
jgi:hypothetical protein